MDELDVSPENSRLVYYIYNYILSHPLSILHYNGFIDLAKFEVVEMIQKYIVSTVIVDGTLKCVQ